MDSENTIAHDPRVDTLRAKMSVEENKRYTADYYDSEKRYIGNAVQVFFTDGSKTDRVAVDYPIGHRKRRAEGIPVLQEKFECSIAEQLSPTQCEKLIGLCADQNRLETTSVDDFMAMMVK